MDHIDHIAHINDFESLRKSLIAVRAEVVAHPLYQRVESIQDVRALMEIHVFAVWDFMSLVKRLQIELTSLTLPWTAKGDPSLRRAINEIVLAEESDIGPGGECYSHYELYLKAMRELGANTSAIEVVVRHRDGGEANVADLIGSLPTPIGDFLEFTLRAAMTGTSEEVAAVFCFGREDLIPDMFRKLLPKITAICPVASHFGHYLARHVEVDGDSHGPFSRQLLEYFAGTSTAKWQAAAVAAKRALELRRDLWTYAVTLLES